jgi:predicted nucleotidyltransferase component of viral defense system
VTSETGSEAGKSKMRQGDRNPGASVQQKLRNRAKATGENVALLLIRYINERFLYRLSVSQLRNRFILRGATLFSVWTGEPHRATRDIDLLSAGDNSSEAMRRSLMEICQQPVQTDGVTFLIETLTIEERVTERIYPGLHVEITAALGTARPHLEIDIAFGEATFPLPQEETVPALLDMPAPRLLAYQRETVVAEKCQAMVHLEELNTRMKDFYDIWYLSHIFSFDGRTLVQALQATFERRGEPFPQDGLPIALTDTFAANSDRQRQWISFLRKSELREGGLDMPRLIMELRAFLQPPLQALADGDTFDCIWTPGQAWKSR